jgi:hypothetical protein
MVEFFFKFEALRDFHFSTQHRYCSLLFTNSVLQFLQKPFLLTEIAWCEFCLNGKRFEKVEMLSDIDSMIIANFPPFNATSSDALE